MNNLSRPELRKIAENFIKNFYPEVYCYPHEYGGFSIFTSGGSQAICLYYTLEGDDETLVWLQAVKSVINNELNGVKDGYISEESKVQDAFLRLSTETSRRPLEQLDFLYKKLGEIRYHLDDAVETIDIALKDIK